jgi:hypothetical protein
MNDFTKEELESLLSSIGTVRVYTEIGNYEEGLYIKIQSMIDRYCDHECTGNGECLVNICDRCARMT